MGIKKITDDTRYRYVLKMLKSGTEIDYDYLIKCYMDKGIININDIMKSSREDLMKSIIGKVHYYAISPTSGNRYMTYIDDCTKPSNRRDIKRKAEEDLYKFLFVYYGTSDLVKNITFKELYTKWVDYKREYILVRNTKKRLSPNTIRRYENDYDYFFKGHLIENMVITNITTNILTDTFKELIDVKLPREERMKNILSNVCNAFAYAAGPLKYLEDNPAKQLDRNILLSRCEYVIPKSDSERILTLDEMSKLRSSVLKHEEKHPFYMPDYAIELAMLTGMRVGELAALAWDMLDENFIHIRRSEHRLDYRDKKSELIIGEPKNGKYRSIPITSEIRNLLNKIKTLNLQSEENFIFVRKDGTRYTASNISRAANRRGKEVGIEKVSVHRVRRTVSSQLNYILPRKDVATLLGHSEKVNEEHYDYSLAEIQAKKQALSQVSVNIINFSDLVMKKKLKESV